MTAYVHYLLVHPDYQGTGIGKRLISQVGTQYEDYLRVVLMPMNEKLVFTKTVDFS